MPLSLINKKIIISGGASGIGWSTAKICLSRGAIVYICDIDSKSLKKAQKHPLNKKKLFTYECDASDEYEVSNFFIKIKKKTKKIDALINNVGIAGAVYQSQETINIPHAYADLRFNPSFDKQTGYFTRSILCVPIINKDGKCIGCTQALNKKGGGFTDEDESRLKAFTQQVAIALENAKLFEDVAKERAYNHSMLTSMSNAVITINDEGKIITCNKAGLKIPVSYTHLTLPTNREV